MAYKIGLAAMCMLVPWLLILAGRGFCMDWGTTILGTAAGQIVWWSDYSYDALQTGASEMLLGALAVLAHTGLLVRFHRHAGVLTWLGLVGTAWLAWFAQPMLFPIFIVLFLIYYIHVGHSHDMLFWHLSLLFAEVLSVALTATWMIRMGDLLGGCVPPCRRARRCCSIAPCKRSGRLPCGATRPLAPWVCRCWAAPWLAC